MLDVVRTKSRGSIERPACLFRLEVGNRKGKKTKQVELSDNGRTVELNSEYLGECVHSIAVVQLAHIMGWLNTC